MTIQENIPLAPLTTLQVGGGTLLCGIAGRRRGAGGRAVRENRDLPLFVLGGGSNLVVADAGWPGLVLRSRSAESPASNTKDRRHE